MRVEVVYTTPTEQVLIAVDVPEGATVEQTLRACGMLERFPTIDLERAAIGIFGKRTHLTDFVCEDDRIEIYRSLIVDPKEARRRRAAKKSLSA